MNLLNLGSVGFDLPTGPLFDDTDLKLRDGMRTALIGENGAGKTTLMRLVLGELEPSRGSVELFGTAGYLPQDLDSSPRIGANAALEVPDARLATGSGGERQKARLEELFATAPDLLLLDEPTHHLDLDGMRWLEAVLTNWPGAVLLVSHDRAFLDAVATNTAFLERGALVLEAGNYSGASSRRETEDAARPGRHRSQARRQRRLEREFHRQRSAARSAEKFNENRIDDGNLLLATAKAETVSNRLARRANAVGSEPGAGGRGHLAGHGRGWRAVRAWEVGGAALGWREASANAGAHRRQRCPPADPGRTHAPSGPPRGRGPRGVAGAVRRHPAAGIARQAACRAGV